MLMQRRGIYVLVGISDFHNREKIYSTISVSSKQMPHLSVYLLESVEIGVKSTHMLSYMEFWNKILKIILEFTINAIEYDKQN